MKNCGTNYVSVNIETMSNSIFDTIQRNINSNLPRSIYSLLKENLKKQVLTDTTLNLESDNLELIRYKFFSTYQRIYNDYVNDGKALDAFYITLYDSIYSLVLDKIIDIKDSYSIAMYGDIISSIINKFSPSQNELLNLSEISDLSEDNIETLLTAYKSIKNNEESNEELSLLDVTDLETLSAPFDTSEGLNDFKDTTPNILRKLFSFIPKITVKDGNFVYSYESKEKLFSFYNWKEIYSTLLYISNEVYKPNIKNGKFIDTVLPKDLSYEDIILEIFEVIKDKNHPYYNHYLSYLIGYTYSEKDGYTKLSIKNNENSFDEISGLMLSSMMIEVNFDEKNGKKIKVNSLNFDKATESINYSKSIVNLFLTTFGRHIANWINIVQNNTDNGVVTEVYNTNQENSYTVVKDLLLSGFINSKYTVLTEISSNYNVELANKLLNNINNRLDTIAAISAEKDGKSIFDLKKEELIKLTDIILRKEFNFVLPEGISKETVYFARFNNDKTLSNSLLKDIIEFLTYITSLDESNSTIILEDTDLFINKNNFKSFIRKTSKVILPRVKLDFISKTNKKLYSGINTNHIYKVYNEILGLNISYWTEEKKNNLIKVLESLKNSSYTDLFNLNIINKLLSIKNRGFFTEVLNQMQIAILDTVSDNRTTSNFDEELNTKRIKALMTAYQYNPFVGTSEEETSTETIKFIIVPLIPNSVSRIVRVLKTIKFLEIKGNIFGSTNSLISFNKGKFVINDESYNSDSLLPLYNESLSELTQAARFQKMINDDENLSTLNDKEIQKVINGLNFVLYPYLNDMDYIYEDVSENHPLYKRNGYTRKIKDSIIDYVLNISTKNSKLKVLLPIRKRSLENFLDTINQNYEYLSNNVILDNKSDFLTTSYRNKLITEGNAYPVNFGINLETNKEFDAFYINTFNKSVGEIVKDYQGIIDAVINNTDIPLDNLYYLPLYSKGSKVISTLDSLFEKNIPLTLDHIVKSINIVNNILQGKLLLEISERKTKGNGSEIEIEELLNLEIGFFDNKTIGVYNKHEFNDGLFKLLNFEYTLNSRLTLSDHFKMIYGEALNFAIFDKNNNLKIEEYIYNLYKRNTLARAPNIPHGSITDSGEFTNGYIEDLVAPSNELRKNIIVAEDFTPEIFKEVKPLLFPDITEQDLFPYKLNEKAVKDTLKAYKKIQNNVDNTNFFVLNGELSEMLQDILEKSIQKNIKSISPYLTSSKSYLKIEHTDGYDMVTVSFFLKRALSYGYLSEELVNRLLTKINKSINNAKRALLNEDLVSVDKYLDYTITSKEVSEIKQNLLENLESKYQDIMNISMIKDMSLSDLSILVLKDVFVGFVDNPNLNIRELIFDKNASRVLLPNTIKNSRLDLIRKSMELHSIDRLSHFSAIKTNVSLIKRAPVSFWNSDINSTLDSLKWFNHEGSELYDKIVALNNGETTDNISVLTLHSNGFGEQTPQSDSDKSIMSSQVKAVIFIDQLNKTYNHRYINGEYVVAKNSGKDSYNRFQDLWKELYRYKYLKFIKSITDPDTEIIDNNKLLKYIVKNLSHSQNISQNDLNSFLTIKEIFKIKFPNSNNLVDSINNLLSTSNVNSEEYTELINYFNKEQITEEDLNKFMLPLLFSPNSYKLQSILNSLVETRLSSKGFKGVLTPDIQYEKDINWGDFKNSIVFTDPEKWNNTQPLKDMRYVNGKIEPAQMVVSWNFKSYIHKYAEIFEEDGYYTKKDISKEDIEDDYLEDVSLKSFIKNNRNSNDKEVIDIINNIPKKGKNVSIRKHKENNSYIVTYISRQKELINIEDYIKEVDGKKILDTKNIDPLLLRGLSNRIPVQYQSSITYFEIVGFITDLERSIIIAPSDFIVRMGSDFDIDTLYSLIYNFNYDIRSGKISMVKYLNDDKELYTNYIFRHVGNKLTTQYYKKIYEIIKEQKLKEITTKIISNIDSLISKQDAEDIQAINSFNTLKDKIILAENSISTSSVDNTFKHLIKILTEFSNFKSFGGLGTINLYSFNNVDVKIKNNDVVKSINRRLKNIKDKKANPLPNEVSTLNSMLEDKKLLKEFVDYKSISNMLQSLITISNYSQKTISNLTNKVLSSPTSKFNIAKSISKKYNSLLSFDDFVLKSYSFKNSPLAIENAIKDEFITILTEPSNLRQIMAPLGYGLFYKGSQSLNKEESAKIKKELLSKTNNELKAYVDSLLEKYSLAVLMDIFRDKTVFPDPLNWLYNQISYDSSRVDSVIIGAMALNQVGQSLIQIINKPIYYDFKKSIIKDNVITLSAIDEDNIKKIIFGNNYNESQLVKDFINNHFVLKLEEGSVFISLGVDGQKIQVLPRISATLLNLNSYIGFMAQGIKSHWIVAITNQPAIKELNNIYLNYISDNTPRKKALELAFYDTIQQYFFSYLELNNLSLEINKTQDIFDYIKNTIISSVENQVTLYDLFKALALGESINNPLMSNYEKSQFLKAQLISLYNYIMAVEQGQELGDFYRKTNVDSKGVGSSYISAVESLNALESIYEGSPLVNIQSLYGDYFYIKYNPVLNSKTEVNGIVIYDRLYDFINEILENNIYATSNTRRIRLSLIHNADESVTLSNVLINKEEFILSIIDNIDFNSNYFSFYEKLYFANIILKSQYNNKFSKLEEILKEANKFNEFESYISFTKKDIELFSNPDNFSKITDFRLVQFLTEEFVKKTLLLKNMENNIKFDNVLIVPNNYKYYALKYGSDLVKRSYKDFFPYSTNLYKDLIKRLNFVNNDNLYMDENRIKIFDRHISSYLIGLFSRYSLESKKELLDKLIASYQELKTLTLNSDYSLFLKFLIPSVQDNITYLIFNNSDRINSDIKLYNIYEKMFYDTEPKIVEFAELLLNYWMVFNGAYTSYKSIGSVVPNNIYMQNRIVSLLRNIDWNNVINNNVILKNDISYIIQLIQHYPTEFLTNKNVIRISKNIDNILTTYNMLVDNVLEPYVFIFKPSYKEQDSAGNPLEREIFPVIKAITNRDSNKNNRYIFINLEYLMYKLFSLSEYDSQSENKAKEMFLHFLITNKKTLNETLGINLQYLIEKIKDAETSLKKVYIRINNLGTNVIGHKIFEFSKNESDVGLSLVNKENSLFNFLFKKLIENKSNLDIFKANIKSGLISSSNFTRNEDSDKQMVITTTDSLSFFKKRSPITFGKNSFDTIDKIFLHTILTNHRGITSNSNLYKISELLTLNTSEADKVTTWQEIINKLLIVISPVSVDETIISNNNSFSEENVLQLVKDILQKGPVTKKLISNNYFTENEINSLINNIVYNYSIYFDSILNRDTGLVNHLTHPKYDELEFVMEYDFLDSKKRSLVGYKNPGDKNYYGILLTNFKDSLKTKTAFVLPKNTFLQAINSDFFTVKSGPEKLKKGDVVNIQTSREVTSKNDFIVKKDLTDSNSLYVTLDSFEEDGIESIEFPLTEDIKNIYERLKNSSDLMEQMELSETIKNYINSVLLGDKNVLQTIETDDNNIEIHIDTISPDFIAIKNSFASNDLKVSIYRLNSIETIKKDNPIIYNYLIEQYNRINRTLGQKPLDPNVPAQKYILDNILNELLKVKNSNELIIFSTIISPNNYDISKTYTVQNTNDFSLTSSNTKFALLAAIEKNIPIFVYNNVENGIYDIGWYKWESTVSDFVKSEVPVFLKNVAISVVNENNYLNNKVLSDLIDFNTSSSKEDYVKGINIKTDKESFNSLANRLTNPNYYADKSLFDVETEYKDKQSKKTHPELNAKEALKYDMNLMYNLQVKKFRQNPELIDEINEQGGLKFIQNSSHWTHYTDTAKTMLDTDKNSIRNRNDRWVGQGLDSNFIKVLAQSYTKVAKELNKFVESPVDINSSKKDILVTEEDYTKNTPDDKSKGFFFTENLQAYLAARNRLNEVEDIPKGFPITLNVKTDNNQAGIRYKSKDKRNLNAFAIISKKYQQSDANSFVAKEGQFADTEEDFELFKKYNTESIQEALRYKKPLVILKKGIATGKSALPLRFAQWLNEELKSKLGIQGIIKENTSRDYEGFGIFNLFKVEAKTFKNEEYLIAKSEADKRPNNTLIPQNFQGKKDIKVSDLVKKNLGADAFSIDMIYYGFRTRTTRQKEELDKYNIKVGSYTYMFGKSSDGTVKRILVKITKITKGIDETSWFKEGWDSGEIKKVRNFKEPYAVEFEKVEEFLASPIVKKESDIIFDVNDLINPQYNNKPEFNKLPIRGINPTFTYAGIGSRETPAKILALMTQVAKELESYLTLNTGKKSDTKEEGADKAFSDGTKRKNLFSPSKASDLTRKIAAEIHPDLERMAQSIYNKWVSTVGKDKANIYKQGAIDLQARNTYQIFGENLDTPVDFVLFWAKETKNPLRPEGGTGQAVEMARRKGIPTINMADSNWREQLDDILSQIKKGKLTPSAININEKYQKSDKSPVEELLTSLRNTNKFIILDKLIDERLIKQLLSDSYLSSKMYVLEDNGDTVKISKTKPTPALNLTISFGKSYNTIVEILNGKTELPPDSDKEKEAIFIIKNLLLSNNESLLKTIDSQKDGLAFLENSTINTSVSNEHKKYFNIIKSYLKSVYAELKNIDYIIHSIDYIPYKFKDNSSFKDATYIMYDKESLTTGLILKYRDVLKMIKTIENPLDSFTNSTDKLENSVDIYIKDLSILENLDSDINYHVTGVNYKKVTNIKKLIKSINNKKNITVENSVKSSILKRYISIKTKISLKSLSKRDINNIRILELQPVNKGIVTVKRESEISSTLYEDFITALNSTLQESQDISQEDLDKLKTDYTNLSEEDKIKFNNSNINDTIKSLMTC
ncbi:MAG TPA: hypothetical protein PKD00_00270 [Burkholderiales bacterium]|nr:hypothetical protein [Burkholderiales bacterium]